MHTISKNIKALWEMLYLPFEMLYGQSKNAFVFFEMVCACFVMLYPFFFWFCVCTNLPRYFQIAKGFQIFTLHKLSNLRLVR